jgi:two-component system, NarL family, response regulator LiaR
MGLKLIRVLIIAGERFRRKRIAEVLRFAPRMDVIAGVSTVEEAVKLGASGLEPHVVLLDYPMLRSTPATIHAVRDAFWSAEVIALVSFIDDMLVEEPLQAGAIGCVSRNELYTDTLLRAIVFAYNGMRFRVPGSGPTGPIVPSVPTKEPNEYDLTEREIEVLGLLVGGLSNEYIAERLVITPSTVKFHMCSIRSKLKTTSRKATVEYAQLHDLVPGG